MLQGSQPLKEKPWVTQVRLCQVHLELPLQRKMRLKQLVFA
jgi:hypothetical protein